MFASHITKQEKVMAQTAEERGMAMMTVPMGQLPYIAVMFNKHKCAKLGGCMEVFLTSWTVYAQCVEGLECTDDLYIAREEDKQWFRNEGYEIP